MAERGNRAVMQEEGPRCKPFSVAFLLTTVLRLAAPGRSSARIYLTLLNDTAAKCMDGTQAGFYYEPAAAGASEAARTGWVVHLQGGGECTDEALCSAQLSTKRGSSNYWDPYLWDLGFLASNNPAQSPNLSDWNHVFVPYCSQDLHSGQVTVPSDNTFGLYFAGHLSLAAVVESLKKQPAPAVVLPTLGGEAGSTGVGPAQSLANATTVVLSGDSAGGIGTFINVDWLQEQLPQARVVAA